MALSRSTARRYAEAAFEIAERDDTVEAWLRRPRPRPQERLADPSVAAPPGQPGRPAATRVERARAASSATTCSGAPRNLLALLVRRGRIELLPAVAREFRRLYAAARASSRPP